MNNLELFKAVFEHTADGIVVLDPKGIIRVVNPAASLLFGYGSREMVGKKLGMLIHTATAQQHNNTTDDQEQHCVPVINGKTREVNGRKKDGSLFTFYLSINKFYCEGQTLYTAALHDISALKSAEPSLNYEKEENQVNAGLVSIASHEFRSPLSRIQLSASLIERYYERLDRDRIMDHLRKIRAAVEDMTNTLNDFLSIERIEAGNIKPDKEPFDLVLLGEELTGQMQDEARDGLRLLYRHRGANTVICLDRTLLRHCLLNLLSNALKYSKETGTVELATAISPGRCTITVRDAGIGIPEKDRPKIFSAFFRAANTSGIAGTGLGLNIVRSYVQIMGGKIFLRSQEGKGTAFTLTFSLPGI